MIILTAALLIAGCSGGYVYQNAEPLEMTDLHYPFPSKTAVVRGIHVSYMDQGSGAQTLLLVHGLASNGGFWRMNIAPLSAKYRVIAVDLPGYGQSEKKAYPYTPSFFADVLSDLLKTIGIDKVVYVGHSMGGQIGIHFALRHAAQLEKLVLTDPAGFEPFSRGDGDWMKSVMTVDFVKRTNEDRVRANLALNFCSYNDSYEWMVEERCRMAKSKDFEDFCYAVIRSVHGMLDEPTTKLLAGITVPTLIIFGEQDGLIPNSILHGGSPADIAAIGTRAIPHNTLRMIPEAGHMVQIEQPERYNAALLEWLRQ
jgi:pimeloyl-ACP methyl ester carboxylesterase